jgi:uncharacterized membrane protein
MEQTPPAAGPQIRVITARDVADCVAQGFADFRAAPLAGFTVGCVFAMGGMAVVASLFMLGVPWLAYPTAAGFVLIGPFAALSLYEVSRRRERGERVSLGQAVAVVVARPEVRWMAFVTLFIFIIWMYQVRLMIALFLGIGASFSSLQEFLRAVFGTPEGLVFLTVGNALGAVLALVVFTLTVVSFPMLLDRDVDFITAMITSVQAVIANPVVMIGWGVIVTVVLVASMAPGFLGLVVALPVLGHATWHLYRRLIAPAP